MRRWLALAAILAAAGVAAAAPPPALAPDAAVHWRPLPAVAAAASEAAGSGSQATVFGDAGVGCFVTWISAPASSTDSAAIERGFAAVVARAGGTLGQEVGDGARAFVLGRYHGVARLSVADPAGSADVTACLCTQGRYPERAEAACAPVWR